MTTIGRRVDARHGAVEVVCDPDCAVPGHDRVRTAAGSDLFGQPTGPRSILVTIPAAWLVTQVEP